MRSTPESGFATTPKLCHWQAFGFASGTRAFLIVQYTIFLYLYLVFSATLREKTL